MIEKGWFVLLEKDWGVVKLGWEIFQLVLTELLLDLDGLNIVALVELNVGLFEGPKAGVPVVPKEKLLLVELNGFCFCWPKLNADGWELPKAVWLLENPKLKPVEILLDGVKLLFPKGALLWAPPKVLLPPKPPVSRGCCYFWFWLNPKPNELVDAVPKPITFDIPFTTWPCERCFILNYFKQYPVF